MTITDYVSQDQRDTCYECPNVKGGNVRVKGNVYHLECRKYTEVGNALETKLSARLTDIYQVGLIHIVEIGVDDAKFNWGKKLRFRTQSRGMGGLDKYTCGFDPQTPSLIKHDKKGFTERLYVHYEGCVKNFISTELQDMVYNTNPHGKYTDDKNTDHQLSDMMIEAARETVTEDLQYTDIIGVYKGANKKAAHYDGILAQAWWAYAGLAYFHTVKFTLDEESIVDGTYIHLKYAGCEKTLLFDSTMATDEDSGTYSDHKELYEAIVNWLNDEVRTENDLKYVDATYVGSSIFVSHKWAEEEICLDMSLSSEATIDWKSCKNFNGVIAEQLQSCMPIDERPCLCKWRRYTLDNVLTALPEDIYKAQCTMDESLLRAGQEIALYIDSHVWKKYRHALKTRPRDASAYDITQDLKVIPLDGLSVHGGTGLWFLTVYSASESNRNIAHLVDTKRNDTSDIYLGIDESCETLKLRYDVLHGVMVKDFRLFCANLLCSPFVKTLKTPHEKSRGTVPCYNPKVRDCFKDWSTDNTCNMSAGFKVADEYKNGALYSLNGVVSVLNVGETMPAGAESVYEMQLQDMTTGLNPAQYAAAQYSYVVTFDDGTQVNYTGQNPIIQYAGSAAGLTFNVQQTVTLANCGFDTFNASTAYDADFPFVCKGSCDEVGFKLSGVLTEDAGVFTYSISDDTEYNTGDGAATIEVIAFETGTTPGAPIMEFPEDESVDDYSSNGFTFSVKVVTEFGCEFEYTAQANAAGALTFAQV